MIFEEQVVMIAVEIEVRKWLRQGWTLRPIIFNLYTEATKKLKENSTGIKIQRQMVSILRFCHDIAFLALSKKNTRKGSIVKGLQ